MRLDQHFDALVPTQISDEHDRPVRMRDSLVEEKVIGDEVGDDLIGTPSGQPRAERYDRADGDERSHVFGSGAAAERVRRARHPGRPLARATTPHSGRMPAATGPDRRDHPASVSWWRRRGCSRAGSAPQVTRRDGPGRWPSRCSSREHALCRNGPQPAAARSRPETQGPRSASRAAVPGRCRGRTDVGQSS